MSSYRNPRPPFAGDLTGRMARCAYFNVCGMEAPSSRDLWFFEYRGPGSKEEDQCQVCGMYDFVHASVSLDGINPATGRAARTDHVFVAREPSKVDTYYCACRGTD